MYQIESDFLVWLLFGDFYIGGEGEIENDKATIKINCGN